MNPRGGILKMNQMIRAAVTIVSISLAHLCASTANAAGSWTAWGWNLDGQATVPVDAGFRQIAAGNLHSIGLREDGTVMGWGEDTFGQASPPGGLLGVIQVAAGGWYQLPGTECGGTISSGNAMFRRRSGR
jgi:hypothetical protein